MARKIVRIEITPVKDILSYIVTLVAAILYSNDFYCKYIITAIALLIVLFLYYKEVKSIVNIVVIRKQNKKE